MHSPRCKAGESASKNTSTGGSAYPLFIPLGFPGFHSIRGIYPFWGEGCEHQQAFRVRFPKGYVKGVCTLAPLEKSLRFAVQCSVVILFPMPRPQRDGLNAVVTCVRSTGRNRQVLRCAM